MGQIIPVNEQGNALTVSYTPVFYANDLSNPGAAMVTSVPTIPGYKAVNSQGQTITEISTFPKDLSQNTKVIYVLADSGKYTATGGTLTKTNGTPVTEKEITDQITFSPDYSDKSKLKFEIDPNITLPNGKVTQIVPVLVKIVYPDKSEATVTVNVAVTAPVITKDNEKYPAIGLNPVVPVANPSELSAEEIKKVTEEVTKKNPQATGGLVDGKQVPGVVVNKDGSVTLTYPDGSQNRLTPSQTVKQADSVNASYPTIMFVANRSALTPEEVRKVTDAVKKANPLLNDPTASVTVAPDGTVTANFPDGSIKVFYPMNFLVGLPTLTTVPNMNNLTPNEMMQVKDVVLKANPNATVKVMTNGQVEVTLPNGASIMLEPAQTVEQEPEYTVSDPDINLEYSPEPIKAGQSANFPQLNKNVPKGTTFSLNASAPGFSIDPDTGELHVDNYALPGEYELPILARYPDGTTRIFVVKVVINAKATEKADIVAKKSNMNAKSAAFMKTPSKAKQMKNAIMKNKSNKLPQTGEKTAEYGILGLLVAALGSLIAFAGRRRKNKDK